MAVEHRVSPGLAAMGMHAVIRWPDKGSPNNPNAAPQVFGPFKTALEATWWAETRDDHETHAYNAMPLEAP